MTLQRFEKRSQIAASAEALYAYHAAPGAFLRLSPPWDRPRILAEDGPFETRRISLRVQAGPLPVTWVAQHADAVPGRQFTDRQQQGPFASWEHVHRFEPLGDGRALLHDDIRYALPLGPLGRVGSGFVKRKLSRMFAYRHAVTAADLERHAKANGARLTVVVAGRETALGESVAAFLQTGGHEVLDPADTRPVDARLLVRNETATVVRGERTVRLTFGALLGFGLPDVDPKQPWLALDDAVGALFHALLQPLDGELLVANAAPGRLPGRDLRATGWLPRLPTLEQARAFELGLQR